MYFILWRSIDWMVIHIKIDTGNSAVNPWYYFKERNTVGGSFILGPPQVVGSGSSYSVVVVRSTLSCPFLLRSPPSLPFFGVF